jgi:iron complex transport system substrate-binding protein
MNKLFCLILLLFFLASPQGFAMDHRIISLIPSQTELLFEMGFESEIIAVSDYCNFPEKARQLPRVGGIELDLEKIVSLRPTVIIDLDGMHRRYELFFRQVGLAYRNYQIKKLAEIPLVAQQMALDLQKPEGGKAFAETWAKELADLSRSRHHLRVYAEIWDAPLQGAGPRSFIGEIIEYAGGKNVLQDEQVDFPVIDPERIIKTNPEVILVTYPIGNLQKIGLRPGWSEITAIRKGWLRGLDYDTFVRPGPRCLKAIKTLSRYFRDLEKN